MLKSKTLLIVGAGASAEANLPLGAELMPKILSSVMIERQDFGPAKADRHLLGALAEQEKVTGSDINYTINNYIQSFFKMREGLKLSISIDNYLDAHQEDKYIQVLGKIGIVKSILNSESESLMATNDGGHFDVSSLSKKWYVELFKIMNEGIKRQNVHNFFDSIEIISFNYDRCIEHFFAHAIASYYSIDLEGSGAVVSRLKIHHPYGQVGLLPWQMPNGATPFGQARQGGSQLLTLAARIKTFTERHDDDALLQRMREAVQQAETIVFLGFAFHPQNLELIAPPEAGRAKRVFASAYGMSRSDIQATRDDIAKWLRREDEHLPIEIADLTCSQLFGEYRRSIPRA